MSATFFIQRLQTFFLFSPRFFRFLTFFFKFSSRRLLHLSLSLCYVAWRGGSAGHVTYRPRRLWVRRRGGGLVETPATVSGAAAVTTAPAAAAAAAGCDGRDDDDDDDDDDDEGWTGIVAAALEQRMANRSALHISAHSERSPPSCTRYTAQSRYDTLHYITL